MARLHASLIALLLGGARRGVWRLAETAVHNRRLRTASGAGQPESLHQRGGRTGGGGPDGRPACSRHRISEAGHSSTAHRDTACSTRCGCTSSRPRARRTARTARSVSDADVGDVAVIQDQGDIILPPNAFDLRGTGCGSRATAAADTTHRRSTARSAQTLGRQLTLGDDDSVQVNVPFSFNFYNAQRTVAFVNSDGNVTFEEEDSASTERNVARLLTGPARVSPFLADLDPSGSGRIYVNAASDQYTVTWCAVRGFDSTRVSDGAGHAPAERHDRDEVRRRRARRRGRRPVARPHRRFPCGQSERQRADRRAASARSASASPSRASSISSR